MSIETMIEAMKQALEALLFAYHEDEAHPKTKEAITSLRQAIAEAEKQDGYCQACDGDSCTARRGCVALSNPPPQRQPLTDDQINSILVRVFGDLAVRTPPGWRKVVRAIEAAHGIGPNE
jgi:hypothetical protein